MKATVLVFLFVIGVSLATLTEEEEKALLKSIKEGEDKCNEEYKDVKGKFDDAGKSQTLPQDERSKCYLKCRMIANRSMKDDGSFDVKWFLNMYFEGLNDEMVKFCEEKLAPLEKGTCESAYVLHSCVGDLLKKYSKKQGEADSKHE